MKGQFNNFCRYELKERKSQRKPISINSIKGQDMQHDYFWYYVAAGSVLLIIFLIRLARRNRHDYHYNDYYYQDHGLAPIVPDSAHGQRIDYRQDPAHSGSQTDFHFFSRRFMNEIDRILERCQQAANRDDLEEAERLAHSALRKVDRNLGRDHWYAFHALGWLGQLRYRAGYLVEAREYWEKAVQVGQEWHNKLGEDLSRTEEDLERCINLLGF